MRSRRKEGEEEFWKWEVVVNGRFSRLNGSGNCENVLEVIF
jgi:hypothetical protein